MRKQIQTPEEAEKRTGHIAAAATVGLLIFLAAILTYAYAKFLPPPPEQAVRRFLVAHQDSTWDYVEYSLIGPVEAKALYTLTASHCRLVGFRTADSFLKRLSWSLGHAGEEVSLKMHEYYAPAEPGPLKKVEVEYILERHEGMWLIRLDSIISDSGIDGYLSQRGVPTPSL